MTITALAAPVLATSVLFGAQAMRAVPRISIDELNTLMSQTAVLVIDVRDATSYEAGRIPGAVNVDYTQILKSAKKFTGETRTIVTYCACANETTAARAAVDLQASGIAGVKALRGGWDEWVHRGEPIEK